MTNLKYVFKGYSEAFGIIERKKLKIFYLLPGVLSLFLISLLYFLSNHVSFNLFKILSSSLNLDEYSKLAYYLLKILVVTIGYLIYFLIYKGLVLVLLSPFLSYISEKVEEDMHGVKSIFSLKDNMRFIGRGIVVSSKYFIFEISGTLLVLILGFVPLINLLTPLILILMQGFFAGASIIDYSLERRGMTSTQSLIFVKNNLLFTTVNGIIFVLFFMLPIIGMFMAPLVSCVAITRGTVELLENR
ncbi:MAG: EI24 domain-containing protein [Fusobacteriaceae bacterium]